MQDPRGLSGAVLQREPMRDFAKDYAFGQERRAEQAAQRQKQVDDGMSQFDFNFESSDHEGWYTQNILQPLKERMTAYAEAKASGDMETARTLNGEISQLTRVAYNLPTRLNNLYKSTKDAFNTAQDPKAPQELRQQASTYNQFVDNLSAFPTEFRDGQLFVAGMPESEVLTPRKFVIKEPELSSREKLYKSHNNPSAFNTVGADGSIRPNVTKISQHFDAALRNPNSKSGVAAFSTIMDVLEEEFGMSSSEMSEEFIAEKIQEPEIISKAKDYYTDYVVTQIQERGATKTEEEEKGGSPSIKGVTPFATGVAFESGKRKVSVPSKYYSESLSSFKGGDGERPQQEVVDSYLEDVVLGENGEVYARFMGLTKKGTKITPLAKYYRSRDDYQEAYRVLYNAGVSEDATQYIRIDENPTINKSVRAALGVKHEDLFGAIKKMREQLGGGQQQTSGESDGLTDEQDVSSLETSDLISQGLAPEIDLSELDLDLSDDDDNKKKNEVSNDSVPDIDISELEIDGQELVSETKEDISNEIDSIPVAATKEEATTIVRDSDGNVDISGMPRLPQREAGPKPNDISGMPELPRREAGPKPKRKFKVDVKPVKADNLSVRDSSGEKLQTEKDFVILHQTGTPYSDNLVKGTRIEDADGNVHYTGAHYYIDKDGTIYNSADEKDVVYHAGKSRIGDEGKVNERSVGIEIISNAIKGGDDKKGYYESLTEPQLDAVAKLLAKWAEEKGLTADEIYSRVFGHHQITTYNKNWRRTSPDSIKERYRDTSKRKTKTFGQDRFLGTARKVDVDNKTYEQIMTRLEDLL